jgi:hypothetical protein
MKTPISNFHKIPLCPSVPKRTFCAPLSLSLWRAQCMHFMSVSPLWTFQLATSIYIQTNSTWRFCKNLFWCFPSNVSHRQAADSRMLLITALCSGITLDTCNRQRAVRLTHFTSNALRQTPVNYPLRGTHLLRNFRRVYTTRSDNRGYRPTS